jgi:hypothetical protein
MRAKVQNMERNSKSPDLFGREAGTAFSGSLISGVAATIAHHRNGSQRLFMTAALTPTSRHRGKPTYLQTTVAFGG